MIDNSGWLDNAQKTPSPNFNERPAGEVPRLVVIHNISLPPGQFGGDYVERFFTNQLNTADHPYFDEIKDQKVSAHVFIKRTGDTVQFVSFNERAWHAGRSCYLGVPECNDYSIGIELEGTDTSDFTKAQYLSLKEIVSAIHARYPLTRNHMAGHSDISPGRKTDPGEKFNWQRFRLELKEAAMEDQTDKDQPDE